MAPPPRLRILSVGSNAISAFLSWRLQATTSCDVTLVWKSGFESVSQYGVSFKSKTFGNERFKPRHVVRTPEEASSRENTYDYVILCVKALPDVYDLASVIEAVVTPQHTCILVNTTNTIGVEAHLEQRYPTNVILSLVSGVEITQTGPSEFEHMSSCDIHIGVTNNQSSIPISIQNDMANALSMTLASGQVNCNVSQNIKQEQFERMIGPIAFQPASVIFDTPNHSQLFEKVGVRQLISGVIDELLELALKSDCKFPSDFRQKTIDQMIASEPPSMMYQDFMSRRPMEVETYLGSPIKLAAELNSSVPRIEALYAMLHHLNATNINKPRDSPPASTMGQPPPRMSSAPQMQRPPMMNGAMRPPPPRNHSSMGMQPGQRRGPGPGMMRGPPGGPGGPGGPMPPPGNRIPRDPSMEGLEEFSHLMLYDEDGGMPSHAYPDVAPPGAGPDFAIRERELAIRQRELQLREQEMGMGMGMGMRRGPGPGPPRRGPPPQSRGPASNFDEEDEDYFDPMDHMQIPHIDPDSVDMMSITSRRTRKAPSRSQMRNNLELASGTPSLKNGRSSSAGFGRYFGGRKRASDQVMQDMPGLHESLMDNPMMMYSSNRYASVDRNQMHQDSRANSLTASQMGDYTPRPFPPGRRNSQTPSAPGNGHRMGRPMTAQDHAFGPPGPGGPRNGHPSPPGNVRPPGQQRPQYGPGSGPGPAPGPGPLGPQMDQQYGVSSPYPTKVPPKNKSLTGSASASAESGDSGASANLDSEASAHSSQASLREQQIAAPVR